MIRFCCSLQKSECERITPVDLYKRENMSNLLRLFITKEQREWFALFHEWTALLLTKSKWFAWRCEMCWLIGSATDFWGRGPRFESGISHNDPGALQDHCVILQNLRVEKGSFTWDQKKYKEKICLNSQPLKIMTYILK